MNALSPLLIEVVHATPQRAFQAAEVKAKYKLYYVDSFAAALAIEQKATLVTSDSDFRKLGHGFPMVCAKAARFQRRACRSIRPHLWHNAPFR
jgi:hypothetical protein